MASATHILTAPPKFVLFGDSITQFACRVDSSGPGWAVLLGTAYERKADIINRGFSGYNTRWALAMLPQILSEWSAAQPPALVTVFFGANDAALAAMNPQQHVPLDEYKRNLQSIVQTIRARFSTTKVILIAPVPLDEIAWARECASRGAAEISDRHTAVSAQYSQACVDTAAACGVPCLDLRAEMTDHTRVLCDGLHLSAAGNRTVYEGLLRMVEQAMPELAASRLPWHYPYWKEVDNADPRAKLVAAAATDGTT